VACLIVETCKTKYLAIFKEIYEKHPDDLLIAKTYAKALLLFHGSPHLSLIFDGVLEASDA